MTRKDLNNASEAFKKRNPHIYRVGAMDRPVREQDTTGALVKNPRPQRRRNGRLALIVTFIAFRSGVLDDDNLVGSCKGLRDAVCESIGIDDGDSRIRFQYTQCATQGQEGTLVHIECF